MPLELYNAPAIFQEYINNLLRDYLDQKVIVYLDDILIYSINREEHDALIFKVLKVLQAEGLTADITKCIFDAESVSFLGFVLFSKGVSLANNIVQMILD
jgi:recombinational DNA repair protein (RecF pathway)